MSSAPWTVGRYVVETLAANGVDTVFGIPGVHNIELYRGLEFARLRHVLVRHEQNAGFAADGYARASGAVAAAFVISGPGLTNALTAIAQAYSDSVPLLVIASSPVRASLGKRWGVLHELEERRATALARIARGRARAARGGRAAALHRRGRRPGRGSRAAATGGSHRRLSRHHGRRQGRGRREPSRQSRREPAVCCDPGARRRRRCRDRGGN